MYVEVCWTLCGLFFRDIVLFLREFLTIRGMQFRVEKLLKVSTSAVVGIVELLAD